MNLFTNDLLEAYDDDGNKMTIRIIQASDGVVIAQCIEMCYKDGRCEKRYGRPGEWDLSKKEWRKV